MNKKGYQRCFLNPPPHWSLRENLADEVTTQVGTPSPVPRRLAKTPSRATLSPKGERAKFSHRLQWGANLNSSTDSWARSPDSWTLFQLASMVLISVLVSTGVAVAGSFQPRIQIQNVVQVESEAVRLSDLLPPDAPAELSEICRRVILGNAPLPASPRVISRVQIAAPLREFPSTLEQLEIPDRVIVTRKRRRLSATEIQTAIEIFIAGKGLHGLGTPNLKGLNLQAPVFVTKPDPGLEVKRVEPDRVQQKTRFLLRTSKEPQVLPFYVTVEGLLTTGESTPQVASPPNLLVEAGKPAKLVIETATLHMMTLVTPLQSGVNGQIIRVRNQDTNRVLKAAVVGRGLLQAELEGE